MGNSTPLVSIILPTYNGKKERFKESIESVLNQTFKNYELIIINDASTNNIEETILEYKKKDNRIIYIKNEENLKLSKTLNKGLSIAKGKYISRMDDDDIREDKNQLEQLIKFMEENTDYGITGTNAKIMDENGNFLYKITRPDTDKKIRENMLVGCWFIHSSTVIRRDILNQVGQYNPKRNMVEDYELRLRIGKISKMRIFSNSYIKYRQNTKSISNSNYKKQKWLTLKLFFKYYKDYPKKHLLKALCFRFGELIVPPQITRHFLNKIGNIRI